MRFLIPRFFSYTTQLQHGVLINLFVVQQRNYKAFHLFNPSYVRLNLFKLFLRYNNHLCTPLSIQFILVVTEWAYFNFFVAGSINSRPKQSVVKISVVRSRDFEVKVRRDRTWAIPTNWCVLGAKAFFSLTPSAFIVWRRSWRSKQKFLNWQSLLFLYIYFRFSFFLPFKELLSFFFASIKEYWICTFFCWVKHFSYPGSILWLCASNFSVTSSWIWQTRLRVYIENSPEISLNGSSESNCFMTLTIGTLMTLNGLKQ